MRPAVGNSLSGLASLSACHDAEVTNETWTGIAYPELVRGALVGMIRSLLARVAAEGFPGDHHFFLTFRTDAPGVELPGNLRQRYPQEMTIVLQNQFWGLEVGDTSFGVTLRFGGAPTRMVVPWDALTAFVDPSASFGLRLAEEASEDPKPDVPEAEVKPEPTPTSGSDAKVVSFRPKRTP